MREPVLSLQSCITTPRTAEWQFRTVYRTDSKLAPTSVPETCAEIFNLNSWSNSLRNKDLNLLRFSTVNYYTANIQCITSDKDLTAR